MLLLLAANVADLFLPIGLLGNLSVIGTVMFLYRLWNFLRSCFFEKQTCSQARMSCMCSEWSHSEYVGFVGLVDKEPDVIRGIMIDTGASINIHGQKWLLRKPCDPGVFGVMSTE